MSQIPVYFQVIIAENSGFLAFSTETHMLRIDIYPYLFVPALAGIKSNNWNSYANVQESIDKFLAIQFPRGIFHIYGSNK